MRIVVLTTFLFALCGPLAAEQRPIALPEILIGGNAATQGNSEKCVEVEIGSSRTFNCLNQKLRRQVDRVNPTLNTPSIDARSPDILVGIVNVPAVQQQYGRNYGVSVMPFRPAPPIFNSTLAR